MVVVVRGTTVFKWKINSFLRRASPGGSNGIIFSDSFPLRGTDINLRLEFCPTNLDSRTHSSLYIRSQLLEKSVRSFLKCRLYLQNRHGDIIDPFGAHTWVMKPSAIHTGYDDFVSHDQLFNSSKPFVQDGDYIFICCEIKNAGNPNVSEQDSVCDTNPMEYVASSVTDGCVVRVGTEKFYLSKDLLSKSETFDRLLALDGHRGFIEIADVRPEAAEAMLNFICFGQMYTNITPIVEEVFCAADKFERVCLSIMNRTFTPENIFRRYFWGYYQTGNLDMRRISRKYLESSIRREHFEAFLNSEEWSYLADYYDEAIEMKNDVSALLLEQDN